MKKLLSILLATLMIVASFTFVSFAADTEEVDPNLIPPDKSWWTATGTTFEISTAAQFLGIGELLTDGVDFDGQTIKLTANIDVNPGWSADAYMKNYTDGDDWTIALAPSNVWAVKRVDKGLKNITVPAGGTVDDISVFFKGTLDGQNHYVSGLYASQSSNDNSFFGLGGKDADDCTTFKNIAFVNGLMVKGGGARGACILGVGGTKTVFSNVYVDIDALVGRQQALDSVDGFSGIVGWLGNGSAASTATTIKYGVKNAVLEMTDCVYAGTMYSTGAYDEANKKGGYGQHGIVGVIDDETHKATLEDILSIGTHDTLGKVNQITSKNKGNITMNSVVSAANVVKDSSQVNAFLYDQRVASSFTGSGLAYKKATTDYAKYDFIDFKVTDEAEDDSATPDVNEEAKYKGNRITATELTADEIKTINTVAVSKNLAGYADWTATVDGQAMPISAELAAVINDFLGIELPDPEQPAAPGGEGEKDDKDDDDTTETKAPEETTDAETKAVTEKVEEDKGCGGVIGAGAIAIVAVTGAALAIGKKKED